MRFEMSKFAGFARLVVLAVAASVARGETVPHVMIDYERRHPGGLPSLPSPLLKFAPASSPEARLAWVMVSRDDVVRLSLVVPAVSTVKFEIPHVDVYRAAIGTHDELALAPETLRILRDRQREIALPPRQDRLFSDERVRDQIPEGVDEAQVRARFVERLREGGARFHLAGPGFARVVDFVDLDDFNRASGLALTAADFWRDTLFFWWEGAHEMSGGFVMKTVGEARGDCARVLMNAPDPDQGPESRD